MATIEELDTICTEMDAIMGEGLVYNPKMREAHERLHDWVKRRDKMIRDENSPYWEAEYD